MKIFISTGNPGKLKELKQALSEFYGDKFSEVVGRSAFSAEETDSTFEGNAKIKSHALMNDLLSEGESDFYVLSDDSGLVVDELDGAPGIFSARFAGDHVDPIEHIYKLIDELKKKGVPEQGAHARYVCALSMLRVQDGRLDREVVSRGTCEGSIVYSLKGSSGFGYDPVFWVSHRNCTMAELATDEKKEISHRYDAFRLLKKI